MYSYNLLTSKQIGQRLAHLRKQKGLSQEDLTKMTKIARTSLTQIELGNRGLDVLELQNIASALSFSIDEFLSKDFFDNQTLNEPQTNYAINEERIAVPHFHVEKFKNVFLYLLEKCAGKANVGETVLNKLLYFADFNYYEIYESHLTGAKYRKLPFGPVPLKLELIIQQLMDENKIQKVKTSFQSLPQTKYLPLEKADLTKLLASEIDVIDKVIEQMADWTANAISAYSHKDMPWLASKEGAVINYELVFYRELPYAVRNYSEQE